MSYTEPAPSDLIARCPPFAAVNPATIQYWLTDSLRFVDQSWMEGDYAPALIAHAAYEMVKRSVPGITGTDLSGFVAAGVSDFKSGTFQARFSDEAIKVAVAGGYDSNIYGMEYCELLVRNKSGGGVTLPGHVPCGYGFNGFAGPLPPWNC